MGNSTAVVAFSFSEMFIDHLQSRHITVIPLAQETPVYSKIAMYTCSYCTHCADMLYLLKVYSAQNAVLNHNNVDLLILIQVYLFYILFFPSTQ